MIVWGGHLGTNVLTNTGGRYDPIGDAWTSTPTSSLISARYLHTAIWTGTEMIVWGGSEQLVSSGPGETNTGARFLPSLNLWLPTSTVGAPVGRYGHAVVWTGSEMLVWGGQHSGQITTSGGRYDPSADAWTPMGDGSGPSARTRTTAVWTGNELIIWGGLDPGAPGYGQVATGGRYDPLTDTWLDTPIPMIQGRESHSAVWTGQWMVVWGGTRVDSGTRSYLSDGAMYDPVADSWLLIPSGGLTGRVGHAAVWTGDRMIVWGPSDGGVFDPETLGWAPMTSTGSPSPRTSHTMIWTGEEAIVWGGSGPVNTGARYDPVGDVWTPLALVGAPSPRSGHTAIWNGSRMIVWGGIESSRYSADTGAAYDPAADLWTPISAIGAAGPRDGHTAVWTGTRMIVWGGRYSEPGAGGSLTTSDLGDGGSYIPVTDTWSPMSLDGAPPARSDHRAVWSGQAMLIWGGGTHDGGSYRTGLNSDVDLDSWTPCDGDCDDGEPATHPGAVEICDGADNDCDGALPGEVDADGDGLWECEGDCDDTNPARFPGNPETCDGVDNDCDDVVDGFITTCGMGECASGGFCSGGVDSCVPGTPVPELCDNLDNDCDGAVDGFSTACGVGQCAAAGTCSAGADSCVPGSPTLEVCDGVDNDCDGSIPADEADDDGDGSRLCDGDCAPSDPSIFAGAPEINDGTDNQCPGDYGFGIIDEISGQTTMSEVGQLCWPSQGGATLYRIVRAETRDFTAGCVSNTSASSCWTDPETPASGAAFQYVVRAEAPHVGSWGLQGDLTERGVACTSEQDCANGTDDDGDGLVDCADAEDCFRDPACGSASFQLLDLPSDDAADTDLADFFSGVPALATDYIHFSLAGNGLISFEWCAERADVYRDDYLAYAPGGNVLVSGGWSAWYREGGGVWSAPVATEFPNYYGNQCLGAYSWCAETELGNRGLAIVPSDTAGCEAVDLVYGCGDGTWVLAITLGVDRISACGF